MSTGVAFRSTFVFSLLASACGYDVANSTGDLDAVLTVADGDRDFNALSTFAMPEEVRDLEDLVDAGREVSDTFDQDMLDLVATNMAELGYTRIADADAADVTVLIGKVASNNWYVFSYYDWWYYPGWPVYYPPYQVPVNYPTGSVIVTMLRPAERDMTNDAVPAIWFGGVRGLLSSSRESNRSRVEQGIDQMFIQSEEYLRTGDPVAPELGLDVLESVGN